MVTAQGRLVNTPLYGKTRSMKQVGSAKRSGRLTAGDWVDAAYSAMAEDGVGSVAVEPLARRLGVTRGSFYWHFKDRRALLEVTLERWERESTEAVISVTRSISDPMERFVRLAEEAFGEVPWDDASGVYVFRRRAFELAVSDAADDPVVRPFLRRVTERRVHRGVLPRPGLAAGRGAPQGADGLRGSRGHRPALPGRPGSGAARGRLPGLPAVLDRRARAWV